MTELADRVSRLEDRAELQDLVARYFLAADGDDLDGLNDAFATDSTFAVSGQVGGRGRKGVIDFLVGQRRRMGLTLHTPNYGLFTLKDRDRASGLIGAHLELVLDGEAIYGAVRYADDYVREGGAWKIAHRDMRTIQLARWDELATAFASDTPVRWPGGDPAPSEFPRKISAHA
jgi:hypothetical protein